MTQIFVSRGQYDAYEVILKGTTNYELDANFDANFNDFIDVGQLGFGTSGTPIPTVVAISSISGDMYFNCLTTDSFFFRENGTTIVEMDVDGIDIRTGFLEMTEITPPSGLANHIRFYADDNGAGKTRLLVQFGNGAPIQLAIEP